MTKAKWIWANTPEEPDEYVVFYDEFIFKGDKTTLDISVSGDYAVYINGELIAFGQYADYENYKVYDSLDITSYLKAGKNVLKILCWYIGADFFTSVKMPRGLKYVVYTTKKVLAYSKQGTLCSLDTGYLSHQKRVMTGQLGYSYCYDTRYSDERLPLSEAVECESFGEWLIRPNKKTVLGAYVSGKLCDESKRIYDLGKECCGFLKIKFKADAGSLVSVGYGEHLIDGTTRYSLGGRDFTVQLIGSGKKVEFLGTFRRLGCRYLQVLAEESVEIEEIGIQEVEYPFTVKPYEIKDSFRKKIYDISLRTLQLCAHEHYEDCPWREQSMYLQDSRNQMLCGYYAFDNAEFTRSAILLALNGQRGDGLFEICFPARNEFTIASFSIVFPAIVLEYTQATGDMSVAKLAEKAVERVMDFFLSKIDDNGLFKTVSNPTIWHFYEWAGDLDGNFFSDDESLKNRNGYDSLINAFLALACDKTALLYEELGDLERAKYYRGRRAGINKAIHEVFFDSEKLLYKTYADKDGFSQLANALCVLCGACPDGLKTGLAEKIAYGFDGWVENTLSMNIYRFDALLAVDKEKYSAFVLAEIDRIYKNMLSQDATSFWETEKGAEDFDGAGSLCHGWSAIPIYYYHKLGIVK